jgi:uncharacterized protein
MLYDDGKYQWDTEKAAINEAKHGISFEEAREVFADAYAVEFFDDAHSIMEARFQRIGLTDNRLLFVVYTERDDRTRIIHARKATKAMEKIYVEHNPQL